MTESVGRPSQGIATRLATARVNRLLDALADRGGVAALEFALVIPILLLTVTGIIQFGFILFLQNHMSDVAREAARGYSVGKYTETEAEDFARNSLLNWGITYTVDVEPPNPADPADDEVNVQISIPLAEATLIDVLGIFDSGTLRAQVAMREE